MRCPTRCDCRGSAEHTTHRRLLALTEASQIVRRHHIITHERLRARDHSSETWAGFTHRLLGVRVMGIYHRWNHAPSLCTVMNTWHRPINSRTCVLTVHENVAHTRFTMTSIRGQDSVVLTHQPLAVALLTFSWCRHEYQSSGKPCTNSISGFCFAPGVLPPTTMCSLRNQHLAMTIPAEEAYRALRALDPTAKR